MNTSPGKYNSRHIYAVSKYVKQKLSEKHGEIWQCEILIDFNTSFSVTEGPKKAKDINNTINKLGSITRTRSLQPTLEYTYSCEANMEHFQTFIAYLATKQVPENPKKKSTAHSTFSYKAKLDNKKITLKKTHTLES